MDKTLVVLIVIAVIIVGLTIYADLSDPAIGFFR